MNPLPHIYALIIGSEILNRRRQDKHFDYLSLALQSKGQTLYASFTIKDDKELIYNTLQMIKEDSKALLFCFGGIGSTPDDLTRQLASDVFSDGQLHRHPQFEKDIIQRLKQRAYPHPITMSDLPKEAKLLHNTVNNMSGFQLEDCYFFMPGFPQMAQGMVDSIIKKHLTNAPKAYKKTFLAQCGEARLIDIMKLIPKEVELSALPLMNQGSPSVEIELASFDEGALTKAFEPFLHYFDTHDIYFKLL